MVANASLTTYESLEHSTYHEVDYTASQFTLRIGLYDRLSRSCRRTRSLEDPDISRTHMPIHGIVLIFGSQTRRSAVVPDFIAQNCLSTVTPSEMRDRGLEGPSDRNDCTTTSKSNHIMISFNSTSARRCGWVRRSSTWSPTTGPYQIHWSAHRYKGHGMVCI